MKKIIALSIIGITLSNISVMPVTAFTINDFTVYPAEITVSNTENTVLTVKGSSEEDIVLRLFDSDNSLVYTDVILAADNTGEDDVFEFQRPDSSEKEYTAVISSGNEIKQVSIKYTKTIQTPGGGGGGGGGGTGVMSDSTYPWTSPIEDLANEIKDATDEKRAIQVIKDITDETDLEKTDIESEEQISDNASNTVENIASNLNAKTMQPNNKNILSLSSGSITKTDVSKLNNTMTTLTAQLTDGQVNLNRGLFSEYIIKTAFDKNEKATIRVTKELLNEIKDLDILTIADENFRVSYDIDELTEMIGDMEYIEIVVEQPENESDGTVKKLKINFNTENVNTMKVSFPGVEGNTDYMSVVDENGNPVGGKYNALTGCIEAKINSGGMYSVVINEKDFVDIKDESEDVQNAIKLLASKGIIEGTSETEFSPDSPITRAEIAALMLRIIAKNDPNEDGGFADVTQENWYFGTAGSSKKYGLINGYEDNTFRGDNIILKDQLTAIAARLLRSEMRYIIPENLEDYLDFTDRKDLAEWSLEDIATARMADIVLMSSDGAFHPVESMTRGNASLIIMRMYNKIK